MEYVGKPVNNIKKEGLLFVLTALIGVGSKEEKITDLNPNKLVYDIFGNVDEIEPDLEREECNVSYEGDGVEADFLSQYKSLCGHLLQKKYKYEDYLKGGLSLLKKDKGLKKLYEAKETSEVLEILKDKYEKEYQEVYISSCKINRKKYLTIKWALVLVSVLLVGAISYICVNHVRQTVINKAIIKGHESYLMKDYLGCLDALSDVTLKRIDKPTKMILAVSFVKSDNLTQEQKDNIITDITNTDAEIIYDYWILISRNMYEEAENTAKQLSDDELLLYAYMKESLYLRNNTGVDGNQKAARLDTLQNEIDKLSKVYENNKQE